MYIGEKIICLELHKTGSSHVTKILNLAPSCKGMIYGKHETIYEVPKQLLGNNFAGKVKAGNIRNPWDWYVSLWAYGCMGEGGLHGRLTSSLLKKIKKPWIYFIPAKKWAAVYADVNNPQLFREWLKMMLAVERRYDLGEGYGQTPLSDFAGFYTYRYLNLHTYDFKNDKKNIKTYSGMLAFDKEKNMLDYTIKLESLNADIKQVMLKIDIPLAEIDNLLNTNTSKTNPSVRKQYQHYYDDETRDLVYKKDIFLVEKYNYQY